MAGKRQLSLTPCNVDRAACHVTPVCLRALLPYHTPCAAAGTYGEFVAVDEDKVCLVPPGLSLQHAAAVPVAGMTAWQALEPVMPLAGKRVLIHGGAGGVGSFAVQVRGLDCCLAVAARQRS